MAIRIPILTSFDPKGIKQANASFATLQSNIGSLGRNFAVAGAAVVGMGAYLSKTVNMASAFGAEFEGVNQIFGESAKTVQRFAAEASKLAGVSETEALRAAKNFGGFATAAGLGGQAAADFAVELVQAAGDLASFNDVPVADALAAIQSGLAGQSEPLRNFQILLSDTTLRERAFAMELTKTTDQALTPQQKVLATHAELMDQMGVKAGDFVKYGSTFGNSVKTITAEFDGMQTRIGLQLIPIIEKLLPQISTLTTQFGTTLLNAVKKVDFEKLLTDLVNLAKFLIENIEVISQVVIAAFALNTAFKLLTVVTGLATFATDLYKYALAKVAGGMTAATIGAGLLRAAMMLLPWGIAAAGLALVIAGINESDSSYRTTTPVVTSFGEEVLKSGKDAEWAAGKYGIAKDAVNGLSAAISSMPTIGKISIPNVGGGRGLDLSGIVRKVVDPEADAAAALAAALAAANGKTTGSSSASQSPLQQLFADPAQNVKAAKQTVKLQTAGLSEAVAKWITSVDKPVVAAREAQAKISKNGAKAIANISKKYEQSTAGQAAAAAAAASSITESFSVAYDDTADKEAAALAERQRVFASFADSVKSTFAGIKNGIINAFDLNELGGSSNSITRNMDKLLTRLRAFATNVKSLASMGLDPALLQQVISAGPMGGARLAEALVMGGASGLSALNAGYSEFGNLSSQIAQTGTESLFNQGAQQSIYNISVDGGVGSGSTIGKAIVDAIKAYERTSGAVWQGA